MKKRPLGNTGISVHEIGYGAMHLSIDAAKRPPEAVSIDLLRRAVDELGIDFIDTADAYCTDESERGHNERLINKALSTEQKARIVIATKGGSVRPEGRWERNGHPEHLRSACEASLKALGLESISLYQLHAPDPDVPVEESVGTLSDLQTEGKIEHVGVSNFSLDQLKRAMEVANVQSLQNQYSVTNRRDQDEIVDFCRENSITYIPWNPVGGRGNAPKIGEMFQALGEIADQHKTSPHVVSLAWLLSRSPNVIPIPGTRHFDYLKQDCTAADLTLTAEDLEKLNSI